MRRAIWIMVVASLLSVTSCSAEPAGPAPDVAVYLKRDVTEPQKQAIAAWLTAQPGTVSATFEDSQKAYANLKEQLKDEPEKLGSIKAEHLPESFRVKVKDRPAFDRLAAGGFADEVRKLPGVDDVVIPGKRSTTPDPKPTANVAACLSKIPPMRDPPEQLDIRVLLAVAATVEQKQAIEARLRAVPGAAQVTLVSRQEAYEEFQKSLAQVPSADPVYRNAKPGDLPESYTLMMVDRRSLFRAADDKIDATLCAMPGVSNVIIPPKPLR